MGTLTKKVVYSPYDISKLCRVDPPTITQWFNEGKLRYFLVPGGHPRLLHSDLEKFLAEQHLPEPDWDKTDEKFRVLVIEDDPDMLEIIGDLLREEPSLDIRKEDNGFNAGLMIANWHPDLILLDFVMPGLSGFDVCRKIREHADTKDISVLALTSLSTFENKKAVMNSGVSDFLGKPFHSEVLFQKVRLLLGMDKAHGNVR